jgi:hypothetical protein
MSIVEEIELIVLWLYYSTCWWGADCSLSALLREVFAYRSWREVGCSDSWKWCSPLSVINVSFLDGFWSEEGGLSV